MRLYLFLLTLVLLIGSPTQSWADSDRSTNDFQGGYLQQDILFNSRTNIYDQSGSKKGYVQQDIIFNDTKNIYDKDGRRTGYIRQDPLFKDQKVIYDKNGRTKGYLRKDSLFKYRTNIQKR